MDKQTVQLEVFRKKTDFYLKTQSLKPAWLRESGEAVDADRVYIWGKGVRQRPHINGSGQRPTLSPDTLNHFESWMIAWNSIRFP